LDIADVIDELNSIRRLFEAQKDVLTTAARVLGGIKAYADTRKELLQLINQDIGGYMHQIDRLSRDAKRTRVAVFFYPPT